MTYEVIVEFRKEIHLIDYPRFRLEIGGWGQKFPGQAGHDVRF